MEGNRGRRPENHLPPQLSPANPEEHGSVHVFRGVMATSPPPWECQGSNAGPLPLPPAPLCNQEVAAYVQPDHPCFLLCDLENRLGPSLPPPLSWASEAWAGGAGRGGMGTGRGSSRPGRTGGCPLAFGSSEWLWPGSFLLPLTPSLPPAFWPECILPPSSPLSLHPCPESPSLWMPVFLCGISLSLSLPSP